MLIVAYRNSMVRRRKGGKKERRGFLFLFLYYFNINHFIREMKSGRHFFLNTFDVQVNAVCVNLWQS